MNAPLNSQCGSGGNNNNNNNGSNGNHGESDRKRPNNANRRNRNRSRNKKKPKGEEQGVTTSSFSTTTTISPVHVASPALQEPPVASLVSSNDRFTDHPLQDALQKSIATHFRYEFMTPVQAATVTPILQGHDVLAKAKTGTGKTLAFLIPLIHRLERNSRALIISPTRELAFQIQKEAVALLQYTNLKAVTLVGGTSLPKDLRALAQTPALIVATPGRLLDHLQNHGLNLQSTLQLLVLDEADQLLDMGFRPDLERIFSHLPASRQTLLFSATLPSAVNTIAKLALNKDYQMIDTTVGDNDSEDDDDPTHSHVPQTLHVTNRDNQREQLYMLATLLAERQGGKTIVFFPTARWTSFWAEIFRQALYPDLLDIHSRKSQSQRQKTSSQFLGAKNDNAILFSSDVSARGMDYPNVTLVVQVGWTERATYIHRLGRTARAGKGGSGRLVLADYESRHMVGKELSGVPVVDKTVAAVPNAALDGVLDGLNDNNALVTMAQQHYAAWLGYYKTHIRKFGWTPAELVQQGNQNAKDIGLLEQPRLQAKTVGKMGLKGTPGLLVDKGPSGGGGGDRGGGRRGGGGGRGGGGRPYQN